MDTVTAVQKQRGKYIITFNEAKDISVPRALFMERTLSEGEEIDLSEYEDWLTLHQYRPALDRAVALLAQRARSEKEISDKLLAAGYLQGTVEMVLVKLRLNGLTNDEEFAAQWAAARGNGRLGKRRIAMELRQKGIGDEDIAAALLPFDDQQQADQALAQAEKLCSRYAKDEPEKARAKLTQALVRRGFSWEAAGRAAKEVLQCNDVTT